MGKTLGKVAGLLPIYKLAGGLGAGAFNPLVFLGGLGLSLLSKGPRTEGQHLTNIAVQVAQEGSDIPRGWGLWRQAGTIVYASQIFEESHTTGSRKTGQQTDFTGFVSVMILGGRGPITRINRIWFNNIVIYDYNGGDPRLMQMTYNGSRPIDPPTFDSGTGVFTADKLRIYTGTPNQPVDPYLESVKGVGKTPAYINRWGVFFEFLQLGQFGNQLPNITFEPYYSVTDLPSIITEIYGWLDKPSTDLDLSELEDIDVRGFAVSSRTQASGAIEQLMRMYNFRLPEVDGVIRAVKLRDKTSMLVLTDRQVRWQSGQNNQSVVETTLKQTDENQLPEIEEIQFWDVNRDNNPGYRYGRRQVVTTRRKDGFAPSAALKPNEAQQIADITLGEAWQKSDVYSPSFGLEHLYLSAADVVTLPDGQDVILSTLQVPLFGAIPASAPAFDGGIYDVPLGPDDAGTNATVATIGNMTYEIIDANAANDSMLANHGVYIAASMAIGGEWRPATFACDAFLTSSGGGLLGGSGHTVTLNNPCTMGVTYEALADAPDSSYTWDRANVLKVDLMRGTLDSVTEADLLANSSLNQLLHGEEIIQFATATFIGVVSGKNRYELTGLLRGRRGTESFTDAHSLGEAVVLLDSNVAWVEMNSESLNVQVNITVTAPDGTSGIVAFTPSGNNLRPYSPDLIRATKSGSDFLITWVRRTRLSDTFWATGADAPLAGYDLQKYLVQVLDGGGNVLAGRQTTTESFTYTAAMQVDDFGSVQSSVTVQVKQMSQAISIDAGYPGVAVIP